MKKLTIILFISFVSQIALAQTNKTAPVITTAFSDSLKQQITRIISPDFSIRLLYKSSISDEGKLLKPLITRQISEGNDNYNDFVVNLRLLLLNAPAWEPAFDNTLNKAVADSVLFSIVITKGDIVIEKKDSSFKLF
jgi:hypothetical protein